MLNTFKELNKKNVFWLWIKVYITQYSDFQLFLVWNFSYLFVFSSIELYGCVLKTTTMDGLLLRSLQIIV
jgi:hypothetical protein